MPLHLATCVELGMKPGAALMFGYGCRTWPGFQFGLVWELHKSEIKQELLFQTCFFDLKYTVLVQEVAHFHCCTHLATFWQQKSCCRYVLFRAVVFCALLLEIMYTFSLDSWSGVNVTLYLWRIILSSLSSGLPFSGEITGLATTPGFFLFTLLSVFS